MIIRRGLFLLMLLGMVSTCWARGVMADGYDSWDLKLEDLKVEIGDTHSFRYPPDGESGTIFGTGVYSSHSAIGTAAVHSGIITLKQGGAVTILVTDSMSYFAGSNRNGISSVIGGRAKQSFVFLDEAGEAVITPLVINWESCAAAIPAGMHITAVLPANGRDYFVFGSEPYDVFSAIGAAAVQQGLISFQTGGEIKFQILDQSPESEGFTANGVTSLSTASGNRSFQFILP